MGALQVGVVIETPASVLMAKDLAREADFCCVHLVSLVQHVLATDRENAGLRALFETPHPALLRALQQVALACAEHGKPLSVFGVSTLPAYLPFLIGLGILDCTVPPGELDDMVELCAAVDAGRVAADADSAAGMASALEIRTLVEGHLYGWARLTPGGDPTSANPA